MARSKATLSGYSEKRLRARARKRLRERADRDILREIAVIRVR